MTANAVVRARIDERTKKEAAAVLEAMGLTLSDAFRLMVMRIAKEKALPFAPLVPNPETIDAMKAARRDEYRGRQYAGLYQGNFRCFGRGEYLSAAASAG
ncbi:MAG: type II toxin-antitoxin system RelB/DinJ family antitoxin, partial [Alphaproteobacteria bacterium]|nr:type II toxin-antitoxin system RelB/DinJ family antitoxin [Alphaproteobacteria bacterium]